MKWNEVKWSIKLLVAGRDFISGVVVEPAVFWEISVDFCRVLS
jgi:hypothetical protein